MMKMCDYCGTDVLPICECGREYVNTPHALADLRAENARLRSVLMKLQTSQCFGNGEVVGLDLNASPLGREIMARIQVARAALAQKVTA